MVLNFIELKMYDYIEIYGQKDSIKIMEKLNASKLFNDNLQIAINQQHVANAKTINGIIHSSNYAFLFAPKRKIYFGSLFYLKALYINFKNFGIDIDEHDFMGSLLDICKQYEN